MSILKPTTVCNVKVAHIRPTYGNLKEWTDDPTNIYIGRPGVVFVNGSRFPKHASPWANPFKVGRDGSLSDVLDKYNVYIRSKIADEGLESELNDLEHHNLGCWCVPCTVEYNDTNPIVCHGQILLQILNESK